MVQRVDHPLAVDRHGQRLADLPRGEERSSQVPHHEEELTRQIAGETQIGIRLDHRGVGPPGVFEIEDAEFAVCPDVEQVVQISLNRRRLKLRWGQAGQTMRVQQLQFDSVEAARGEYIERVSEVLAAAKVLIRTIDRLCG